MFNMHRNQYRTDHWPTLMSREVGKEDGTCYALTFIRSPREQEVWPERHVGAFRRVPQRTRP